MSVLDVSQFPLVTFGGVLLPVQNQFLGTRSCFRVLRLGVLFVMGQKYLYQLGLLTELFRGTRADC